MTTVTRPGRIRAEIDIPPDKSISHRALLFNAIASGRAVVEHILDSLDVRSTARCLAALGVPIDWPAGSSRAVVQGVGLRGLAEAADVLDCGNSGTTMRLLAGLLAPQPALNVLTGDASLRSRPMRRVIEPLRAMGARIDARQGGTLAPLAIRGDALRGIEFASPVASAQVKSALLLAGLFAEGETRVTEPSQSRDHTERMLAAMGAPLQADGPRTVVRAAEKLEPLSLHVPGDISSAAPWMVLAACHPDAEVRLRGVNANPSRTGLIDIMRAMGANIEVLEERLTGGEPVADIVVRSSRLRATAVGGSLVPRAIDELPLVAVLAAFAEGETVVADAAELRTKESDRVQAVARALGAMGVRVAVRDDGFAVCGPVGRLRGAAIDAEDDHRIGMLAAVAGALAEGETTITNGAVDVSYPRFFADLARAAAGGAPAVSAPPPLAVVIHGPSGVGKDTVIAALRARTGMHRATSTASRAPRKNEVDGVDYYFVSEREFERRIAEGRFLEYARVHDEWKGLEAPEVLGPLSEGRDVIIRTDVQGARTWRQLLEGAIHILLVSEDRERLRQRLADRQSEDADSIARRLADVEAELADAGNNDYVVVNRDGAANEAAAEIEAIIDRERYRPGRSAPRLR